MPALPIIFNLADEDTDRFTPFSYLEPLVSSNFYGVPIWRHLDRLETDLASKSPIGKDGFQVCMDVAQFKPSELTVKVVDNSVLVEGKHEEREDEQGHIMRHFVRRYTLPKGYESEKVTSTLSSDGVLTVSVPKPQVEDKTNERIVQIQQTGPAHLNIKPNSSGEEKKKKEEKSEKKK